jgi:hypothetical protein
MRSDESQVGFDSTGGTEAGAVGGIGTRVGCHRGGDVGAGRTIGGNFTEGGRMATDGAGKRIEEICVGFGARVKTETGLAAVTGTRVGGRCGGDSGAGTGGDRTIGGKMATAFFPRKIRLTTLETLDFHEEAKPDRSNNRSLVRREEERVAVISQCTPWLKLMAAQHSRSRTDLIIVRQSID